MNSWMCRGLSRCVFPRTSRLSSIQCTTRQSRGFLRKPSSAMSTLAIEYGYIEAVEPMENYRLGGYHLVRIRDRLHDRYRIVHKLGHGAYSTAWLALDERTSKYVAVKVGTADADINEANILSHITAGAAADRARTIPVLLDRFSINGPNGNHPCFVTIPARCSLQDSKGAGSGLLRLEVARSLAVQLMMAIALVHSKGYVHGDPHLGNILLQLPSSLNHIPVEQLYAQYGAPAFQPVMHLDGTPALTDPGVPSHAVPPVWLGTKSNELVLSEAKLLLSDFGVAFRPSDRSRFESYTPLVIRPPEALFEPATPLSFPSDMWSLGCVLFELFAHRPLIDGFFSRQEYVTAQQVHLQGAMPREWWERWEQRAGWFDEDGKPVRESDRGSDKWTWESRFERWVQEPRAEAGMEVMSAEEWASLRGMLRCMMAWRPGERPSTEEVLQAEWMRKWALPAYEEGRKLW